MFGNDNKNNVLDSAPTISTGTLILPFLMQPGLPGSQMEALAESSPDPIHCHPAHHMSGAIPRNRRPNRNERPSERTHESTTALCSLANTHLHQ